MSISCPSESLQNSSLCCWDLLMFVQALLLDFKVSRCPNLFVVITVNTRLKWPKYFRILTAIPNIFYCECTYFRNSQSRNSSIGQTECSIVILNDERKELWRRLTWEKNYIVTYCSNQRRNNGKWLLMIVATLVLPNPNGSPKSWCWYARDPTGGQHIIGHWGFSTRCKNNIWTL